MEKILNLAYKKIDLQFFKEMFSSKFNKMDAKKFYNENIKDELAIAKRLHDVYGQSTKYDELRFRCKHGSLDVYIEEILNGVKESMTDEETKLTLWNTLDRDELYALCVREVSGWK